MKILPLVFAVLVSPVFAAEPAPTLNDLPAVLKTLRGCTVSHGMLSGSVETCRIESKDLWASVNGEGELTLFRNRSYGDTTYARGHTVSELLQDFAAQLNRDTTANKMMLDVMAPYLKTQ